MDRRLQIANIRFKDLRQKLLVANKHLDPFSFEKFHRRLWGCVRSDEYLKSQKMGPITIALNPFASGAMADILAPPIIEQFLSSGHVRISNVFIVDYSGKIIANPDRELIENPADAADKFKDSGMIVFFLEGNRIEIFADNLYDCIPDIQSHDDAVKIGPATLPIDKYKNLLDQHHDEKVFKTNILRYWSTKSKRTLVRSPEKVFANDLYYYLDQLVADGRVDRECLTRWTDDRTDIRVIRHLDKKIFIFEIKWLGKSETSSYDGPRAVKRVNAGLQQLVEYVKAENQSICGVLVIYDARKKNTKVKWDVKIQEKDARVEDPIQYYLISESASVKGERVAKKRSKKQKDKGS